MPPRRAPSQASLNSRAPSPPIQEEEEVNSYNHVAFINKKLFETPFFDLVDELQQHVRTFEGSIRISLYDTLRGY